MEATGDDDGSDYNGELTPTQEDASPLLFSAHPNRECPECGARGFKQALDVAYGETGVVLVAAVGCEQCGLSGAVEVR